jgi:hypothetical protein
LNAVEALDHPLHLHLRLHLHLYLHLMEIAFEVVLNIEVYRRLHLGRLATSIDPYSGGYHFEEQRRAEIQELSHQSIPSLF